MALPKGWTETKNEWRYRIRDPKRFARIRPRHMRGVEGVYLVGGPLRSYDWEYGNHELGAFVPQALRFKKSRWGLDEAIEWERESFAGGRRENPKRRRRVSEHDKRMLEAVDRINAIDFPGEMSDLDRRRREAELEELDRQHEFAFHEFAKLYGKMSPALSRRVRAAKDEPAAERILVKVKGPLGDAFRAMKELENRIGALRGRQFGHGPIENPGIIDAIRSGDRVTIVNRFGQKQTGRAVMRSSHGGWVLNMGGPHGTPGLADESNIVKVSPRRENPPRRSKSVFNLTVPELHQLRIAKQTLRMSDAGARIMGGMTKAEARAIILKYQGKAALEFYDAPEDEPRANPPLMDRETAEHFYQWLEKYVAERHRHEAEQDVHAALREDPEMIARGLGWPAIQARGEWLRAKRVPNPPGTVPEPDPRAQIRWHEAPRPLVELARNRVNYEGGRFLLSSIISDLSQEERDAISQYLVRIRHPLAYEAGRQDNRIAAAARELAASPGGEITSGQGHYWTKPRSNPPSTAEERAQLGAMQAIEHLVAKQVELSAAIAQVREKADSGAIPQAWELNRMTEAREAVDAATEAVKRSVAVHGAVIEEFHVPEPSRRRNPPRGARELRELYREFHGRDPKNAKVTEIPDLDRLVHLGEAREVEYRAAVPRGSKNTPYYHRFGPGAQLLAPPGGGALVIIGKSIEVSRTPRGRFGYIRG